MSRTAGAKNKPTVAALLQKMIDAAKREGLELSGKMIDEAVKKAGDAASLAGGNREAAEKAVRDKFEKLEIELDEAETADTYKCGNCAEIMASPMKNCPKCGIELKW